MAARLRVASSLAGRVHEVPLDAPWPPEPLADGRRLVIELPLSADQSLAAERDALGTSRA